MIRKLFFRKPSPDHGRADEAGEWQVEKAIAMDAIRNLEETIRMLQDSNKALENFASIAAHDLKSPVNAQIQLTALLSQKYEDALDDKGRMLIRGIDDSAHKMRILIDDLLNYTMISSGNSHDKTACMPALEQALENLADMITRYQAAISYDDLPDVALPPSYFQQIFEHLIRNAIQYAGVPAPAVHIGAVAHQDEWVFSIRDNGQGIKKEYHDIIFEPFQRLHSHNHKGSGIGLALCRKIIENAGGTIRVESAPAQGSSFIFTLPRAG